MFPGVRRESFLFYSVTYFRVSEFRRRSVVIALLVKKCELSTAMRLPNQNEIVKSEYIIIVGRQKSLPLGYLVFSEQF